jgi:cell division protein ZapA
MTEKKKLKVKIFDKEFSLLVENQEIAAELATYVNKIMDDTKEELKDQPTETIAIIAALNIAYDLSVEKNRFREFSIQATDKIKKIKLLLDNSDVESIPS